MLLHLLGRLPKQTPGAQIKNGGFNNARTYHVLDLVASTNILAAKSRSECAKLHGHILDTWRGENEGNMLTSALLIASERTPTYPATKYGFEAAFFGVIRHKIKFLYSFTHTLSRHTHIRALR